VGLNGQLRWEWGFIELDTAGLMLILKVGWMLLLRNSYAEFGRAGCSIPWRLSSGQGFSDVANRRLGNRYVGGTVLTTEDSGLYFT